MREQARVTDRLLSAALERIPPQLEAPPEKRESPQTVEEERERSEPKTLLRERLRRAHGGRGGVGCSVPEERQEQVNDRTLLNEEEAKLYFEYFKHFTTLNVAMAVVVLAIYKEVAVQLGWLGVALVMFALSLFVSLVKMTDVSGGIRDQTNLYWSRYISLLLFIMGLASFTIKASGLDELLNRLLPL